MTDIPTLNWLIIGLEILIGVIWASTFSIEVFPTFRFMRIKYHLNDEYNMVIRKSFRNYVRQGTKTLFNIALIMVIVILSFALSSQEIPLINSSFDIHTFIPAIEFILLIGLLIVFIPRRIYSLLFPYYFIRQMKYFALLGLIFLPLFILDVESLQQIPILSGVNSSILSWLSLLLPTQLLLENGYSYTLAEKSVLFIQVFVIVPFFISLFYQIIPALMGRIQKFGIYEWKDNKWQNLDTTIYDNDDDTAVLLLHGLNSTRDMWSNFTNEIGSVRIMDHLDKNTDERYLRTKIFAVDFSDRLKQTFTSRYVFKSKLKTFQSDSSVQLNNYVWELLYTIHLLKEVKEIERIHIIAHSSSGLIVRQFLKEIHSNPKIQPITSYVGFDSTTKSIKVIDKISWMAVPHFGAKGGSAIFLSLFKTIPFNLLFRGLNSIPAIDKFGGLLLGVGLNAPGTLDVDPYSSYIKRLNSPGSVVQLYPGYSFKNAYALADQVVGSGAIIGEDYRITDNTSTNFKEERFNADHSNAPWEQLSQLPANRIHEYPPIHHAIDVIDWVLVDQ